MADIFGIGTTLGAIGDTAIGALNFGLQKQAFEYQKKQQEYANKWNEYVYEDQKKQANTAVQRYVKDLEAAGMNKLLAAGGSAGTGGITSASTVGITPPQMEANLTEKMSSIYDTVYGMLSMSNDMATSETQRELIRAQTVDTLKSAGVKQSQMDEILYDLKKSMKMNIRTSDTLKAEYNTAKAAMSEVAKAAQEGLENSQKSYQRNLEKKKEYERTGGKSGRRYGYGAGTEYY